jgi:hypothetical protein
LPAFDTFNDAGLTVATILACRDGVINKFVVEKLLFGDDHGAPLPSQHSRSIADRCHVGAGDGRSRAMDRQARVPGALARATSA